MRLLLLIAVIALVVDALYYSGAYTQSAFKQLSLATEQFRAPIGESDTPRERPAPTSVKEL